jgi:F-type H+-transporting ATPase subunit delta
MAEFNLTPRLHDTVFDVDAERIARVYAQAAFAAAGAQAERDSLMDELESLRSDVLDRLPRVEELFKSQLISEDDKLALIDKVFGGRASATLINTLKVMAAHGRLGMVRDMVAAARKIWEHQSGRLPVELETANPLTPDLEQEVLTVLAKVLDADPIVSARVNPDLISGFIIRVGDRLYDASTRTRLEHMRQGMVARAVEAIQRGPERYVKNET